MRTRNVLQELHSLLDHAECNWDRSVSWGYVANDPCVYCAGVASTWDHLIPLSDGGNPKYNNLARACEQCNKAKASMSLILFLVLKDGRYFKKLYINRVRLWFQLQRLLRVRLSESA